MLLLAMVHRQKRRTVFALGVDLDQDLLCAHDLDDLTNVGARLLEQAQLLTQ